MLQHTNPTIKIQIANSAPVPWLVPPPLQPNPRFTPQRGAARSQQEGMQSRSCKRRAVTQAQRHLYLAMEQVTGWGCSSPRRGDHITYLFISVLPLLLIILSPWHSFSGLLPLVFMHASQSQNYSSSKRLSPPLITTYHGILIFGDLRELYMVQGRLAINKGSGAFCSGSLAGRCDPTHEHTWLSSTQEVCQGIT